MISVYDGMIFGRDEGNERFPEDRQVSREHFKIIVVGGDVYIEDLNSSNSTRLNRRELEPQRPTHLKFEDVIEFGAQKLIFTPNKDYALTRARDGEAGFQSLAPSLKEADMTQAASSHLSLFSAVSTVRRRCADIFASFWRVKSWHWSTFGVAIVCAVCTMMAFGSLSEALEAQLYVASVELIVKIGIVWFAASFFAVFANHGFLGLSGKHKRVVGVMTLPLSLLVFVVSILFWQALISYPRDVAINQIVHDCLKGSSIDVGRCGRAVRMGPTSVQRLPLAQQQEIGKRLQTR